MTDHMGWMTLLVVTLSLFSASFAVGENFQIPDWVKDDAKLWSEDQISQSDFDRGLEFLINENVLTTQVQEKSSFEIPNWFKNNAGWVLLRFLIGSRTMRVGCQKGRSLILILFTRFNFF